MEKEKTEVKFEEEKRGRPRVYKTEEERKEARRTTCRNTQRVYRRQRKLGIECFELGDKLVNNEISLKGFSEQFDVLMKSLKESTEN